MPSFGIKPTHRRQIPGLVGRGMFHRTRRLVAKLAVFAHLLRKVMGFFCRAAIYDAGEMATSPEVGIFSAGKWLLLEKLAFLNGAKR